ncbi:MAG TPA: hypothetical protein VMP89_05065 [Solirubrobacteraceae bacterium]|nr:hypothetical protein [Solirubrobacteraceae bacterium]
MFKPVGGGVLGDVAGLVTDLEFGARVLEPHAARIPTLEMIASRRTTPVT